MTKTEAREALQREITKQLGQPGSPTRVMNDGSVTLGWFVNNRFIPLKEAVWKEETAKTKKLLIQLDVVEPIGDIPLVNFDKFSLQLHLNKLATTRSKDRVLQMRAYIKDIFAEAVDQDFLVKDPARKLKVPAQLRATDTTTLTWGQLRLALSKLSLRDRILLELDMTNALRPSELFAFRWKRFDYRASTLTVAETVYKGKIRDWGKTKKSLTVIHIPQQLAEDLQAWRLECEAKAREAFSKGKRKSASVLPDDFMFENEEGWFPRHGQLSQAGSAQDRTRTPVAETDVPGHPQNDRDPCSKEGDDQRRAGCDATLTHCYDYRCIYAGDSGQRSIDDQFHQYGTTKAG
jgi:hypothetical protein